MRKIEITTAENGWSVEWFDGMQHRKHVIETENDWADDSEEMQKAKEHLVWQILEVLDIRGSKHDKFRLTTEIEKQV